jgi:hypothetical protein
MKRIQFKDAVTKRWILQQQHSKTVLAHISAFLKECTNYKIPFSHKGCMKSLELYEN